MLISFKKGLQQSTWTADENSGVDTNMAAPPSSSEEPVISDTTGKRKISVEDSETCRSKRLKESKESDSVVSSSAVVQDVEMAVTDPETGMTTSSEADDVKDVKDEHKNESSVGKKEFVVINKLSLFAY